MWSTSLLWRLFLMILEKIVHSGLRLPCHSTELAALWAFPCALWAASVLGQSLRMHLWSVQLYFASSPCLQSLVWCWEIVLKRAVNTRWLLTSAQELPIPLLLPSCLLLKLRSSLACVVSWCWQGKRWHSMCCHISFFIACSCNNYWELLILSLAVHCTQVHLTYVSEELGFLGCGGRTIGSWMNREDARWQPAMPSPCSRQVAV